MYFPVDSGSIVDVELDNRTLEIDAFDNFHTVDLTDETTFVTRLESIASIGHAESEIYVVVQPGGEIGII